MGESFQLAALSPVSALDTVTLSFPRLPDSFLKHKPNPINSPLKSLFYDLLQPEEQVPNSSCALLALCPEPVSTPSFVQRIPWPPQDCLPDISPEPSHRFLLTPALSTELPDPSFWGCLVKLSVLR